MSRQFEDKFFQHSQVRWTVWCLGCRIINIGCEERLIKDALKREGK